MSEIRLVVFGNPVAKQRARVVKVGSFVRSYTPKQTVEGEASIREVAQQMLRDGTARKLEGAIEAELVFYRAVQASCSRKERERKLAGVLRPVGAPDWDNLGKLACDALNGVLYGDDSQITDVVVRKRYCTTPRTEIVLREVRVGQQELHNPRENRANCSRVGNPCGYACACDPEARKALDDGRDPEGAMACLLRRTTR